MKYWQNKKIAEGGQLNNSWYAKMYTNYFDLEPSFYKDQKILDIGCGPRGSLEWAKMAAERVGLDPLADDYRQLNADQHEMTYVAAKAESMPFEDDYFDVVTAFYSLESVDDLKAAISEIKRVLKPGGLFLLLSEIKPNSNTDQLVATSWKITQAFLPDFQLITEKHYEKTANSLTQSIQQGKIYNHQDLSNRLGILVAMFSQGKLSLNTLSQDSEIKLTQSIISSPTLTFSEDKTNHFVILATKRTGSNLLVKLLNQSPPIICYGEIMKKKYSKEKGIEITQRNLEKSFKIYCNLAEALDLLQQTKYQTGNKSIEYDVVLFNPYLKGGLCNRLRVLTSCMVLSQFWKIPLLMCWSSGSQCDSDFEQLYEPICETIDQEEVWKIIHKNPLKTLYITNPLKTSDWYYKKYLSQVMTQAEFKPQYFKQLKKLKLQSNLQQKIDQYISKNFQHDIVGLHIRQTDMLNLYDRYSLDPSRISDEKFFHKIEQEISQGTSKFFLATDNAETQKIFTDKFPDHLISYCQNFEESRKRQTDVEDAIIDLYLLAHAQKIIGSYMSSFSKLVVHQSNFAGSDSWI